MERYDIGSYSYRKLNCDFLLFFKSSWNCFSDNYAVTLTQMQLLFHTVRPPLRTNHMWIIGTPSISRPSDCTVVDDYARNGKTDKMREALAAFPDVLNATNEVRIAETDTSE